MPTKTRVKDLNEHLFAQIERLSDEDKTPEEVDLEIRRTKAIVELSGQVIDSARVSIEAVKLAVAHGGGNADAIGLAPLLPAAQGDRAREAD